MKSIDRIGPAAIVLLLLAACTPRPQVTTASPPHGLEPPDPLATDAAPPVEFQASVDIADTIRVTYRLVNTGGTDLVVITDVDYQHHDPTAVYITGVNGTNSVQLAKRIFARPSDGEAMVEPAAGGVIVRPGQSVAGQFALPLPLHRQFPYGDINDGHHVDLPDPIRDVSFCLGVFRRADLPDLTPTGGEVVVGHEAAATRVEHLACSPPTPLA